MEPRLREGAARLAWETGAPLVPATIAGAFRAWPHFQSLPRPARVRVRFHAPIDPAPFRARPEEEALPALLDELQRRVDRSLLPGVKADLRTNVLYAAPAPPPRVFEVLPLVVAFGLLAPTAALSAAWPGLLYLAYLVLDWKVLTPARLTKWLRNASAPLVLLAWSPALLRALDLPPPAAPAALAAVVLGGMFPYLYEHRRNALDLMRGLVACLGLELAAALLSPEPAGAHAAVPAFLALFAAERRTVFHRWAAPILVAYAVGVPLLLGASAVSLLPHFGAALGARLFAFVFRWPPALRRASASG
jgi:hypothetical protein